MKNRLISISVAFFLVIGSVLGFLFISPINVRSTNISGIVYDGSGGPWTEVGSPYIIVGDIIVPQGQTLTIEPGVQVKFDGDYFIYVDGTILAIGSETNRIIMSNYTSPSSGNWNGIQINSTGYAEIKYCNISHTDGAIRLYSSSNLIMNNSITNNWAGINLFSSSYNIISNNSILTNLWMGIEFRSYSANNNISNNNISDTYGGFGIALSSYCNNNTFLNNDLWYNTDAISGGWLSTNNTYIGNNICHSGSEGIDLQSTNCTIINNYIVNNRKGVGFWDSSGNNISFNTLINNTYGVDLYSTTDCIIAENNMVGNLHGIFMSGGSNNNTIIHNNINSSRTNGIDLYKSSNNLIASNNLISNNRSGIFNPGGSFNNLIMTNNISENMEHGIKISNVNNSSENLSSITKLIDNFIYNNTIGIGLYASYTGRTRGVEILSSIIFENDIGISYNSTSNCSGGPIIDTTVANCSIENNRIGIQMSGILNGSNNIKYNNITNNYDYAINMTNSSFNLIYHNNFINNGAGAQVFDDYHLNLWNYSYPIGGNFWSDYLGVDYLKGPNQDQLGSDGIGDTPYIIDSDSIDHYPLMEPSIYKPLENCTTLKQGWNFISLALIQQNQSRTKVLEMIDGYYDAVQWYDSSNPNKPWKHYKVNKPYGNDLFELNETMGFWIHITNPGDTIFLYNGTQPTVNQTIILHPGWNMVGYPSLTSYNRTEGLNNLTFDNHVDAIWSYDGATQKWEEMGESDYFRIGRGYYIHVKSECEWEVPL